MGGQHDTEDDDEDDDDGDEINFFHRTIFKGTDGNKYHTNLYPRLL